MDMDVEFWDDYVTFLKPSGLRRCVQVAVHFCGRGFESHFWQIFEKCHQQLQEKVNLVANCFKVKYGTAEWRSGSVLGP